MKKKDEEKNLYDKYTKNDYTTSVNKLINKNQTFTKKIDTINYKIPENCTLQSIEFNKNNINLTIKSKDITALANFIKNIEEISTIKEINMGTIKNIEDGYIFNVGITLKEEK